MILRLLKSITARFRKPLELGSIKANKLVLEEIAKQGDDGTQERHVRHFAYPMRGTIAFGRDHVVDLFSMVGMGVSDIQFHRGLVGEHYAAVADEEFDLLTDSLREELTRMGWKYDGWECAVLESRGS